MAGVDKFGAVSVGRLLIEGKIILAELEHDHNRGDIHNISFDEVHNALFLTDISCESLHQLKPEPVQVLLLGKSTLLPDFHKSHGTGDHCEPWNNYVDFVLVVREIEREKYELVGLTIVEHERQLFKEFSASRITLV